MQTATLSGIQATANITTSLTTIGSYIVPAATSAVISQLTLCNKTAGAVTVQVTLYNGTTDFYVLYNYSLAANTSVNVIGLSGPIILPTSWSVRALCSALSSVDATMSVTQAT
jgi:hypothetical protein